MDKNELIGAKISYKGQKVLVEDFSKTSLIVRDSQGNVFRIKDSELKDGLEKYEYYPGGRDEPDDCEIVITSDISGEELDLDEIYETPNGDLCSKIEANDYDLDVLELREVTDPKEKEEAIRKIVSSKLNDFNYTEEELLDYEIWWVGLNEEYNFGSEEDLLYYYRNLKETEDCFCINIDASTVIEKERDFDYYF